MSKSGSHTKLKQRKARCRTSFEFGEEDLTYMFDNSRTKTGSTIAYHKIPEHSNYREIGLWWLKYMFIFYLSVCAINILYYNSIDDVDMTYRTAYFATLGFLCVCFFGVRYRRGGITSLPLNPALNILHDGRQRQITDEIMKRRAAAMKSKLAQIDYNKPYYEEASKFSWLREEGVINDQEYREARQKIAAMRDKAALSPHNHGSVN